MVEIEFVAGDAPLNRKDDFLYSLFVPARASLAMPVFDQPDLKAKWQLIAERAAGLDGGVERPAKPAASTAPDRIGLVFDETPPISTYLFAFAAGKFSVETPSATAGRSGCSIARPTPRRSRATATPIFDLHAQRARAGSRTTPAIPYPFGKFDFVLIPSFQFGGMEHPGAIFYNASGLLLDETATQNQLLGRASVISHETAHMWFGDLVTMSGSTTCG